MNDLVKRSQENCPFYPGCYWVGDCGHDDWKTSDCGLPNDEQRVLFAQRQRDLMLRSSRFQLGQRLAAEARAGKHDNLLPANARAALTKAQGDT